ncbi:porin [Simiduia aestuariiviva]|uniref:Putative porin n=1 Tax=Simiduia aestuariiviva TaxID=1510459 RepID=A0A839UK74_9GAMM|nr:porin [Simiduia aestuariiviva]MBB3168023.1 putative porin [Simiduia aestuariiviva]
MKRALLATAVACMAPALAVNVNAADIRWNGFASITGGVSTGEGTRPDGEELRLYGYDDDFNFRPESKLALQASSNLGNGLSVTAQAIARGSDDFNVEMEWAFVSYDFGESSRINVGKLRIPFYQYSDFLDVGYAYAWIRPPESVYDLFFSTMEGANLQFNGAIGSWDSGLQLVAGRTANELDIFGTPSDANLKNLWGGAWNLGNDWLTFRAAYFQADTTLTNSGLEQLSAGLAGVAANPALAPFNIPDRSEDLAAGDDKGSFVGFGFKADKNDWLFGGEITQIQVADSFVADQDSAYVTIGRRFNDLVFHVTYEEQENKVKEGILDGIPTGIDPAIDGLLASATGVIVGGEQTSTTVTVGMRYNFHPSASFKIDYSQRDYDSSATMDVDGAASVVRFSIDAIF